MRISSRPIWFVAVILVVFPLGIAWVFGILDMDRNSRMYRGLRVEHGAKQVEAVRSRLVYEWIADGRPRDRDPKISIQILGFDPAKIDPRSARREADRLVEVEAYHRRSQRSYFLSEKFPLIPPFLIP